jgi:hypothetical protein
MSASPRTTWRGAFVLAVLFLTAPTRATSAENAVGPPRVKPLSERTIAIAPWEWNSSSPFGGRRIGGEENRGFAFSPDGSLLASSDGGGWQLELWDVASGKSLGRFGRFENDATVVFRGDGKALVSLEQNQEGASVALWDTSGWKLIRQLDEDVNTIPFTAAAFSPDGKVLALGGGPARGRPGNSTIHLWEATTGDELRSFQGPPAAANAAMFRGRPKPLECMCFSPDGRSLALEADHKIMLWELATEKERCLLGMLPLTARHDNGAYSIAYSPDGRTLAVGCVDGAVRLWDVAGAREYPPLIGHKGGIRAVAFAPDGATLWSLGQDNRVLSWPTTGPSRDWRPVRGKPSEAALKAAWDGLADDDLLTRYAAAQVLAAAPEQAAPFLKERLHPVAKIDAARAAKLAAALNSEGFNERKKAIIELRKLGELALPVLRQGTARGFNAASRRIMQKMESQYPTAEQLQACRAVDALEEMSGDDSRRLLVDLAGGAPEAILTRQAKAALERRAAPTAEPPAAPESLWDDLANMDAPRAYQAVGALAAKPDQAVPLLRDRLRQAAAQTQDDPEQVARLIADLNADDFDTREKASKELTRLGQPVEPALRKALAADPEAEAKRRLQELLSTIKSDWPPQRLQVERALEALERIGGDAGRQALESVDKDARNQWIKGEIAESLRRLKK